MSTMFPIKNGEVPVISGIIGTPITKLLGRLELLIIPTPSELPPATAVAPRTVLVGPPSLTIEVSTVTGTTNCVTPDGIPLTEIFTKEGLAEMFPLRLFEEPELFIGVEGVLGG